METKTRSITTIRELIDKLTKVSEKGSYLDVLKSIAIPNEEMEEYCTWNKEHYTRNCLLKTEEFELVLVCWERGQKTALHSIGDHKAVVHPIYGKLKEEHFYQNNGKLEKVISAQVDTDCFSEMNDPDGIYRYSNGYESRAVSLNLYSKPIESWMEYDGTNNRPKKHKPICDSVYHFNNDDSYERIDKVMNTQ